MVRQSLLVLRHMSCALGIQPRAGRPISPGCDWVKFLRSSYTGMHPHIRTHGHRAVVAPAMVKVRSKKQVQIKIGGGMVRQSLLDLRHMSSARMANALSLEIIY